MTAESYLRRARGCFIAVILLGFCVAVGGHAWLAAYAAATTDVVLSLEELNDPKLIEIVYRTHRTIDARLLLPYYVAGALLMLCGFIGLHALRNTTGGTA